MSSNRRVTDSRSARSDCRRRSDTALSLLKNPPIASATATAGARQEPDEEATRRSSLCHSHAIHCAVTFLSLPAGGRQAPAGRPAAHIGSVRVDSVHDLINLRACILYAFYIIDQSQSVFKK